MSNKVTAYEAEKAHYQALFLKKSVHGRTGRAEEVRTTPLLSLAVKHAVDITVTTKKTQSSDTPTCDASDTTPATAQLLPEYGLVGFSVGSTPGIDQDEPIMLNTNAPNSTFICGSQGSGKSYTLSVMLDNCLSKVGRGVLCNPLAGIAFHYDKDSCGIAEAAYLCTRNIPVNVLISKSSAATGLLDRYLALQKTNPAAKQNLRVNTFVLQDRHLNIERMQRLMAFSEQEGTVPLYMEVVQRILRETAISGQKFSLKTFMEKLKKERFNPGQETMLNMRLQLLMSSMATKPNEMKVDLFRLKPGSLTVVDFSDPLIDQASACVLFDICLGLFKENRPASGLIVALDEAHKFMGTKSAATTQFTDRLLTTIREQRHNATRVIIATQEPTISEKLLDLCSTTIVHRFTSPAWFGAIKNHLGGASGMVASQEKQEETFNRIVDLDVGESLVFSPASFVCLEGGVPRKLGSNIMKMKTRMRLGADGGASVLASG